MNQRRQAAAVFMMRRRLVDQLWNPNLWQVDDPDHIGAITRSLRMLERRQQEIFEGQNG
jgi:hypothetical protein